MLWTSLETKFVTNNRKSVL